MAKKSLAANSIFNMAYKGFTALFPLITTSYISHVILPAGVGRVAYANTIAAYFVLVACLGLPSYGVKVIAQNNASEEERSRTFLELFSINFAATVLCTAAYYLFVNTFAYFADKRQLLDVMGLMLILNVFNIDWFYQGMEEYVYISVRSFIVKVASFGAMLLFVRDEDDYLIYALILCVATAGNNLWNAWNLRNYISLRIPGGLRLNPGRHMRPVLILLASTIATEVYTMLDTVMLEYYFGDVPVGYYSNAAKVVRMVYTLVIALVAVFYPRISLCYKQKDQEAANDLLNRGTKILLLLALPCTLGLFLTAEDVVPLLFGAEFSPAVSTLRLLCILILIFSLAYFLGHIVLTAAGLERMILRATIAGAAVNVCANFALIPVLRQDGAAIASVLSELAVTVILLRHAGKFYRLKLGLHYAATTAAALGLMALAVIFLRALPVDSPNWVLAVITGAAAVYFGGLLVLRNEVAGELWRKLRGMLEKVRGER